LALVNGNWSFGGVYAEDWAYALFFILFAISISVILREFLRDAREGKLLLATSFHALINLGMLLLLEEEDGSRLAMGTLATSCTIAAIFVVGPMRMKRQTTHIGETVERSNHG